jgi:hypothetical protein
VLRYFDGATFTTSFQKYVYAPVLGDADNRIQISIYFNSSPIAFDAILDTGAPYSICAPVAADAAGFDHRSAIDTGRMIIRGLSIVCSIARMRITLIAEKGVNVDVDATVFVPQSCEQWPENLPSFIGMGGFLERIHFGFAPEDDHFHFGAPTITTLV